MMSPTAPVISFSCFHGEKEKQPPAPADDTAGSSIEELYKQAASRLPLGEMPELESCVYAGGNCLGLADPVANIILNAVALLLRVRDEQEQEKRPCPLNMLGICNREGSCAFMAAYFRYLSATQARRYLSMASHDLSLAVSLVHHDRFAGHRSRRRLLPDGGRIKAALRLAAAKAEHPAPGVLAQIMAAQYPSDALAVVMAKLRCSQRLLTTGDVWEIKDLLARQWPPPSNDACPPPVSMNFCCRPTNGTTCTRRDDGTLLLSTYIGKDGEFTAKILIERTRNDHHQLAFISDLTFDNSAGMEAKLYGCLQQAAAAALTRAPPVDYDASPCEHMVSLKLCLLDTIHAMYIKALAMVPTSISPRFLRALLAAGHCYGPMDPVSNIIVNSAWYDMAFPPARGIEGALPEGVLDTGPMARVGSRSLDGLVAMLQHCNLSEHQALNYLSSLDCDLSAASRVRLSNIPAATVAKAAKHPRHVAFGSFLASLTTEKLEHLRYLLTADEGIISDARWAQLIAILHSTPVPAEQEMQASSRCCLSQFALSHTMPTKKSAFLDKLNIVKSRLIEALRGYCNQHPWEPSYHLDIVCGVWQSKNSHYCHANFLASTDAAAGNDAITSSSQRTLFFAKFWVWGVESKPSSCCPIYDYRACNGRCFLCENEANKIIHPPSECHYGHINGSIDLYSEAVHKVLEVGFEGLQDSDFIYVDPDRDVELVEIINDFRDYRYYHDDDYKPPRDWTELLKSCRWP